MTSTIVAAKRPSQNPYTRLDSAYGLSLWNFVYREFLDWLHPQDYRFGLVKSRLSLESPVPILSPVTCGMNTE